MNRRSAFAILAGLVSVPVLASAASAAPLASAGQALEPLTLPTEMQRHRRPAVGHRPPPRRAIVRPARPVVVRPRRRRVCVRRGGVLVCR